MITSSLGGNQLTKPLQVGGTNANWGQPQTAGAAPQTGGVYTQTDAQATPSLNQSTPQMSAPLTQTSAAPASRSGAGSAGAPSGAIPEWGQPAGAVGGFNSPGWQYGMGASGDIQGSVANPGANTEAFDPATMPVQSVDQGQDYYDRMQDAYYGQATSRLDPQWQQRQSDMESQLQNMGLTRGSEAWNREMQTFQQGRNDAYSTAMNEAIMNSGTEAARRQGMDINAGNFANAAEQQDFLNQGAAQQWENAARGQEFSQGLEQGNFANAAQGQGFQQMLDRANLNNQAYGQKEQIAQADRASQASASAARASANASRSAARDQYNLAKERQDFDIARQMSFDPLLMQNMAMEGMFPNGSQSFGNFQTPDFNFNPNFGSTGPAQGAYDTQQGINWGNVIGSLGGMFMGGG